VLDGGNLSFRAAHAEPTRHEDAAETGVDERNIANRSREYYSIIWEAIMPKRTMDYR
jgi:hypothetical protein